MNVERVEWVDAAAAARAIRQRVARVARPVDVEPILDRVREEGDAALRELTMRFDATECEEPPPIRVDPDRAEAAEGAVEPAVLRALEEARANVTKVAEAQLAEPHRVELPDGQSVGLREVPVGAAGVYAPGGRAAYPSSVLMCAVPATVAGVGRIALASPPGPDGELAPAVLAAASICGIEEIYAVGGAQAIGALAFGTGTIDAVDVVAGPGNAWIREAKRAVYGTVGIDSLAGPSELLVVAGADTDPEWAALDLIAQAEHGEGAVLALAATESAVLEAVEGALGAAAGRAEVPPGTVVSAVEVPSAEAAIELANALAPEHLELLDPASESLADGVTTAGCVFAGSHAATAFGDYVAGSNHVLPTGGAGRFTGPLGPGAFRRRISTVQVPPEAASKLAPQVEAIAAAEGFPLHAESAMIRAGS